MALHPRVTRLGDGPIIRPHMDARMGDNINGPSLIRVPDWVPGRLGRYYLYFAHHAGRYIRLAYADDLLGPWKMHEAGVLDLADSHFDDHIASPDVHVDEARRQIRLYYHGKDKASPAQTTRLALSQDGLSFVANPPIMTDWYARIFRWQDAHYALAMPGLLGRSPDGLAPFEPGPLLFTPDMRHSAVLVQGDELLVLYSIVGTAPETILATTIGLRGDWRSWREGASAPLLWPEREYEGAGLPPEPSTRGGIYKPANQLRDPCIFVEGERRFLIYAVAGEHGLALAELHLDGQP